MRRAKSRERSWRCGRPGLWLHFTKSTRVPFRASRVSNRFGSRFSQRIRQEAEIGTNLLVRTELERVSDSSSGGEGRHGSCRRAVTYTRGASRRWICMHRQVIEEPLVELRRLIPLEVVLARARYTRTAEASDRAARDSTATFVRPKRPHRD